METIVNRDGVVLEVGMRVKGFITLANRYARATNKHITGILVRRHGRLYVNSDTEPEKNYEISKFAHNSLTEKKVAWLEIIN